MKKTVCYIIPYSAKAFHKLKIICNKYNATFIVGINEEITITAKARDIAEIEKILADVV